MRSERDNQIKTQVARELKWDSRIGWAQIGVAVNDGVVTLTGSVTSYAKKLAAQQAAHRILGVLDVVNEIVVAPSGLLIRTDEDIARAIRHVLEWDALVPDERIKSTVSDGWVTLEGDVDRWREREHAERTVLRLEGVIGLTNEIKVAPEQVDVRNLRKQIECALERRADRQTERLRIDINGGEVDLSGRVHSWQEKRAVIGSISHAPGVSVVRDHLRVDPYF
jgi:osmotically-inducible protein OsmY